MVNILRRQPDKSFLAAICRPIRHGDDLEGDVELAQDGDNLIDGPSHLRTWIKVGNHDRQVEIGCISLQQRSMIQGLANASRDCLISAPIPSRAKVIPVTKVIDQAISSVLPWESEIKTTANATPTQQNNDRSERPAR